MHKKRQRKNEYQMAEEVDAAIYHLPVDITKMVVDAVTHYNQIVSLTDCVEGNDGNDLRMKEAEEQDAKVFLDGILDSVEQTGR
jgi:hypothetical protein